MNDEKKETEISCKEMTSDVAASTRPVTIALATINSIEVPKQPLAPIPDLAKMSDNL